MKRGILLLLVILGIVACRKEPPHVISVVKSHYTIQEQKQLGKAVDGRFLQDYAILDKDTHPEAYKYLDVLYKMIIHTPDVSLRDSLDWNIVIINDNSSYKIFVSPSGSMYITTGLLRQLRAENQLVCLMAHTVYYLESGAAFDLMKNNNDPLEIGKLVLGEESTQTEKVAQTLALGAYPFEKVIKADEFGINLLCPFSYNTSGLIDVYSNQTIGPSLSQNMPWSDARLSKIAALTTDCGQEDSLFIERYQHFVLDMLP